MKHLEGKLLMFCAGLFSGVSMGMLVAGNELAGLGGLALSGFLFLLGCHVLENSIPEYE